MCVADYSWNKETMRHGSSHNSGYDVPFPSVTSLKLRPMIAPSHIRRRYIKSVTDIFRS